MKDDKYAIAIPSLFVQTCDTCHQTIYPGMLSSRVVNRRSEKDQALYVHEQCQR